MAVVRIPLPWIVGGVIWGAAAVGAAQDMGRGLDLAAFQDGLSEAIERAERSVVAIARVRRDQPGETFGFEFRPDPFGRPLQPVSPPQPTDPDFIPTEYATGVVIDRRGLILTTYHVLGENSDYFVTTADRRVHRATVRAADPRSDLAVLAIDTSDLPVISFGDARRLRKGHIVVALGNPYAIARDGQVSASWGIVSNLARKAPPAERSDTAAQNTLHHFGTLIQTDARLTLGTSGGALLDIEGQMVGLVTALPDVPGYQHAAGYAIPVDETFRRVVETLKEGREVEYGFLGVNPAGLSMHEVLEGNHGVRVQVLPGTPAAGSGMRNNDVITRVGGETIFDTDDLMLYVGRQPAEALVELEVLRGERTMNVPVTLAKYPVQGGQIVTSPAPSWRGLRVDFVTAHVSAVMHFPEGVVATEVEEASPAWKAGLRPGMIIRQVGRDAVRAPRQFHAAVANRRGTVSVTVDGQPSPLEIEPP